MRTNVLRAAVTISVRQGSRLYAAKLSVPELREDRLLRSAVYAMHEMRGHERICEVPELRLAVRLKKGENDEIRT